MDQQSNEAFYYVDGIPTKGLWIDLDSVDDESDVSERLAQAGFIGSEYDGDILVADVQGPLARAFYSSKVDCLDLDGFIEVRDSDKDHEAIAAFIDWYGSWDEEKFDESYNGQFDSEMEFAQQLADDLGYLDQMPESIRCYFDYEKFARDLFIGDYYYSDGHVFNQNV